MSDTLEVDRSGDPVFVHSEMDDAGLTPYAFRVYCHISRRANGGTAWPGQSSIARVCGMSESTVKRAIQELETRNMISVQRVGGGSKSNRYKLPSKKFWILQDTGFPQDRVPTEPPPGSHRTPTGFPQTYEGNTIRNTNEGNPLLPQTLDLGLDLPPAKTKAQEIQDQCQAIYDAYPLKGRRPKALKEIAKALKKKPFPELMAAVKKYALSPTVKAGKYVLLPMNWFHQECWNDQDPNEQRIHDQYANAAWLHRDNPEDEGI